MFYRSLARRREIPAGIFLLVAACLWASFSPSRLRTHAQAQSYQKELSAGGKTLLTIKNRTGRVSVVASDDEKSKASLQASSLGAPVAPADVNISGSEITVRERRDRIDLTVHVPKRSRVRVETETGMVDVIGDFEIADVLTNTGTIHADVPLDALKFKFLWQSSRPRFLSDVELPPIKEGRAGAFSISGALGPDAKRKKEKKKPGPGPGETNNGTENKSAANETSQPNDNAEKPLEKQALVQLNFITQRGVILLNVDPSMAPNDLRERPLTEAARAIVRSGDGPLTDAIRKVSPRMFGDFARTLPPPRSEPSLVKLPPPGEVATSVAPQLMRVNASVTDRSGRAIPGMRNSDFSVYEDGSERRIVDVTPTTEPFNLVLLLDVSGSVEERIDFIRKAARDFLNTASPQDRISIISFHDDIKVISGFSTDRRLLSKKLDELDAGGATALWDALGYTLRSEE